MKKKLFVAIFIFTLALISCNKDDTPTEKIDKYVGSFTGSWKEYKCSDTLLLTKELTNAVFKTTKVSSTNLTGSVNDSKGNLLFNFGGSLSSANGDTLYISQFLYNGEGHIGQGLIVNSKLDVVFGALSCKNKDGAIRVTKEFIQN